MKSNETKLDDKQLKDVSGGVVAPDIPFGKFDKTSTNENAAGTNTVASAIDFLKK